MTLNLDQIEQDLAWARDNADRSAQTRLFVHHVPAMLVVLRALELEAEQIDEVEEPEESEESEPSGGPTGNDWQDKVLADHAAEEAEEASEVEENPGGVPIPESEESDE